MRIDRYWLLFPSLPRQWGLWRVGAPPTWTLTEGSEALVVAVMDTGADLTHPALRSMLWTNEGEIPGNGVDDDSNG